MLIAHFDPDAGEADVDFRLDGQDVWIVLLAPAAAGELAARTDLDEAAIA